MFDTDAHHKDHSEHADEDKHKPYDVIDPMALLFGIGETFIKIIIFIEAAFVVAEELISFFLGKCLNSLAGPASTNFLAVAVRR